MHDLSLEARAGRFTAMLGPNGAGKSTLLRRLAGALPGPVGTVFVDGEDMATLPAARRAALVGYLPQLHSAIFPFRVEDVVLTGRAAFVRSLPGAHDRERARLAMEAVDIGRLADRRYTELSGGERQLVMVARVLAQGPKVILLDEPVAHLDLGNGARLLRLLRRLARDGTTVLAVLHEPGAAFQHADDFLFLRDGGLLHPENGAAPWEASFLSRVYGTPIETVPFRGRALIAPGGVVPEGDES